MKDADRLFCFLLALLQSSAAVASFFDGGEGSSGSDHAGGGFLRGHIRPPHVKGSSKHHGNIFSKEKSRYKPEMATKGKGQTYLNKGKPYPSKGTPYSSKGEGYRTKGKGARSSKSKSGLLHTNIFSRKSQKQMWITKGKGANRQRTKGVIGLSLSKGKGTIVTKGKGTTATKGKGVNENSCTSDAISAESFQLVDATTGRRLQTIDLGEQLFLPELELQYSTTSFAIECVTQSTASAEIGSTALSDNYGTVNVDNDSPWTLSGDNGFDFMPTPLRENAGFWYVVCQPFCGPNGSGAAGRPSAAWFTVSTGARTTRPASTAMPSQAPIPRPVVTPVPTEIPMPTLSPISIPTVQPVTEVPTVATTSPTYLSTTPTITTTMPTTLFPSDVPTRTAAATAVYGLQPNCAVFDTLAFNICLDLSSASGDFEPWFDLISQAADRWERIIASDPWGPWDAEILSNLPDRVIGTDIPAEGVDDIYISVFEEDIDGSGGLFALAGPDLMLGDQIIAGSIQIDPNDIDSALENQIFLPLMLHEIGHVLGIGTLWENFGLIDADAGTYNGANGLDAWRNEIGCSGDLPLSGNHWNEECMQNEFLTPFFRFNRPAPVSSLTMGTLEDLGYEVNRDEEDSFGLSDLGDCGDTCPEANRRLGGSANSTKLSRSDTAGLSEEGAQAILVGAADHFQRRSDASVIAALFEENGVYFSRIVRRDDADIYI